MQVKTYCYVLLINETKKLFVNQILYFYSLLKKNRFTSDRTFTKLQIKLFYRQMTFKPIDHIKLLNESFYKRKTIFVLKRSG